MLEDHARFQAIPGIGKKTAERIVLELKEKLGSDVELSLAAAARRAGHLVARDALVELGYSVVDAEQALADVDPELPPRSACGSRSQARGVSEQFLAPDARGRRTTRSSSARCARAGSTTSSARSA